VRCNLGQKKEKGDQIKHNYNLQYLDQTKNKKQQDKGSAVLKTAVIYPYKDILQAMRIFVIKT
jgi:hypothetical protein